MKWLVTRSLNETSTRHYMDWLRRGNIEGVPLPPESPPPVSLKSYTALLLSGGHDIEPELYAAARDPHTAGINLARDRQELRLIEHCLREGRPIFGVCRGIQIINVALGGRLIQHLPDYLRQRQPRADALEEHDKGMHPLRPVPMTLLGAALEAAREVNTSHHQALDPLALAASLRVCAFSGAGVIEAVEGLAGRAPIMAVQWHPERLAGDNPAAGELLRFWKSLV